MSKENSYWEFLKEAKRYIDSELEKEGAKVKIETETPEERSKMFKEYLLPYLTREDNIIENCKIITPSPNLEKDAFDMFYLRRNKKCTIEITLLETNSLC